MSHPSLMAILTLIGVAVYIIIAALNIILTDHIINKYLHNDVRKLINDDTVGWLLAFWVLLGVSLLFILPTNPHLIPNLLTASTYDAALKSWLTCFWLLILLIGILALNIHTVILSHRYNHYEI